MTQTSARGKESTDVSSRAAIGAPAGAVDPAVLVDQRNALIELMAVRRDAAATRIGTLETELAELQATRSFELIRILSAAKSDWVSMLKLPARMLALAFPLPGRRTPVATTGAATAQASSPTSEAGRMRRIPVAPGKDAFRLLAILDEFTEVGLAGECDLLLAAPYASSEELDAFGPEMLFVESAWRGNGGQWRNLLRPMSDPLMALLEYCRSRGVPTVFWNKEDPVHFDHFLNTARHFDFILTTDADCVPAYRERTGRDEIGVLPFACQPRIHNPIETHERRDAFFFAGSYYEKYDVRKRAFDDLVDVISPLRPIDIFDRNAGLQLEGFRFPERFRSMLKGRIPSANIHEVYKSYRYALNLNSVSRSPTMFARRVFEIVACNTLVVSNYSTGLRNTFGEAVIAPGDKETLQRQLGLVLDDEVAQRRLRLQGLRTVMSRHTWADRLAAVRQAVCGTQADERERPVEVTVIARVGTAEQARGMLLMFNAQTYPAKKLLLVADDPNAGVPVPADAMVLTTKDAENHLLREHQAVAGWCAGDTYGPNYLRDLLLARRYSDADAVGKSCIIERSGSSWDIHGEADRYRYVASLACRSSVLFARSLIPESAAQLVGSLEAGRVTGKVLSVDEFNYCRNGGGWLPSSADDSLRSATET